MLRRLRETIHPLHLLRRHRTLSEVVFPRLDRVVRTRLTGVRWPVYVRLVQNFSYVIGRRVLEPGITSLMETVIAAEQPGAFWDVGANVGFYSWFYLSRVPDGFALLLEPEPDNILLLQKTARAAALEAVVCLPVAVSDAVGEHAFNRDPVSGATGGLVGDELPFITRHYGVTPPQLTVPTTTLDELSQEYPRPSMIKIDVEGGELMVLRGAKKLLEVDKPTMFFEVTKRNRVEAIGLLAAAGYDVRPSAGPEVVTEQATDFVALSPRFQHDWDSLDREWRVRLARRS